MALATGLCWGRQVQCEDRTAYRELLIMLATELYRRRAWACRL